MRASALPSLVALSGFALLAGFAVTSMPARAVVEAAPAAAAPAATHATAPAATPSATTPGSQAASQPQAILHLLDYVGVDYAGHSVVISGDTRFNENLIHFATGTDVLVHEVALARPELLPLSRVARPILDHHTSPEEAGTVFTRARPRLAVYTHIVLLTTDARVAAPSIADLVARTRTTYAGPLEVGDDLTTIDIGDSVTVHSWAPSTRTSSTP